jgi:hypothetical protein
MLTPYIKVFLNDSLADQSEGEEKEKMSPHSLCVRVESLKRSVRVQTGERKVRERVVTMTLTGKATGEQRDPVCLPLNDSLFCSS